MMPFFRMIFASIIGTGIVLGLIVSVLVGSLVGAAGMSQKSQWKAPGLSGQKDILKVVLNGLIVERSQKRDVLESLLGYQEAPATGLYELTQTLKAAAADKKIKGLYLELNGLVAGWAHLETLRRELGRFKEAGKFIVAYAEAYSEKSYYLASIADEVSLYPRGFFEWDGMYVSGVYFKRAMDKWDITPQIFRVGKYKSAIEPFISDKMSDASREQLDAILAGTWKNLSQSVRDARKTKNGDLDVWANEVSVLNASDAYEKKFVDILASYEEVEGRLLELTKAEEEPGFVSWRLYHTDNVLESQGSSENKIAVIFADGEIVSGKGDHETIGSERYAKIFRELAKDEDIKGVVLRVNSPGGSALASDVMWTSTQFLKDKKPIVASFGNVAASGGYYMSAGANYIFAESTTVTGSIGVFGLNFHTEKFFNDHIGMTFDVQKTHAMADVQSTNRKLSPQERKKMQDVVDRIYGDFLNVVTQGRPTLTSVQQAHEIAQGRVWTGADALVNGLVDANGGLNDAIAKTVELAELTDYEVVPYPLEKSQFEEFFVQFAETMVKVSTHWLPDSLKALYKSKTSEPTLQDSIWTRMPFDIQVQ